MTPLCGIIRKLIYVWLDELIDSLPHLNSDFPCFIITDSEITIGILFYVFLTNNRFLSFNFNEDFRFRIPNDI